MNIALLTGTFSRFSGIDRVVAQQAESLSAEGHTVTVVCLEGDMKSEHYKVFVLGMPKSLFWQRVYRLGFFALDRAKIRSAMKSLGKQDTVYSHQYPLNALAHEMQREWGTRYVYYNHAASQRFST